MATSSDKRPNAVCRAKSSREPGRISENWAKRRGFCAFDLSKSFEFCPKFANFFHRQGKNWEFCGFPSNRFSAKHSLLFTARFRKLTSLTKSAVVNPFLGRVLPFWHTPLPERGRAP